MGTSISLPKRRGCGRVSCWGRLCNWVRAQGPLPPPTSPGKALRSEPSSGPQVHQRDGNHSFSQKSQRLALGTGTQPCLVSLLYRGRMEYPPALGCLLLNQPEGPWCGQSSERATWGPGRDEGTRDHVPLDASTFMILQTLSCYLCGLRGSNPPPCSCLENPMDRGAW